MEGVGRRTNIFDIDTVHLLDLVDEQVDESFGRELDDELVDGATGAPLRMSIPTTSPPTAPTGWRRPERARTVRKPKSQDIGHRHGRHGTGPA